MKPESTDARVAWQEWSDRAFARARDERKPVLLSVVAPWSTACTAMDQTTYRDEATVALVNARTIAVRIDADHRPDLADRYDMGGLPGTIFLAPDGRALGGGTFVPPARLQAAVRQLGGLDLLAHALESPTMDPPPPATEDLLDIVFESFDDANAGFGTAPKFPLSAPVRLALELCEDGPDPVLLDRVARTMEAMGWGPLYDEQGGGFFRCAAGADWSDPQPEKLLAPNVALLDLYVRAGLALGQERWLARALDLAGWVNRALSAANGAWRSSEHADPARQFADGNAAAASAMLLAAGAFDDAALGRRAIEGLERVLLATYRPGHGCAHSATGVRGLLTDQVSMADACLDAWEATGNVVYRMMAEELMHVAVRTMWNDEAGLFDDRSAELAAGDPVASARLQPFVTNCEAATVLDRIRRATGEDTFAERARGIVDVLEGRAARFGPLAAHYLLARRAVLR